MKLCSTAFLRVLVVSAYTPAQQNFANEPSPIVAVDEASNQVDCRCFPGDACWPAPSEWSNFNKSIDGRLIATVPLGSPCHDSQYSTYNATQCQMLRMRWLEPELHFHNSASIMAPFFANRSCDPYLSQNERCIVGTYAQYSVNVSSHDHVTKTIKFVTKRNIRLVIRNTGHDYNGKSTGAGAVAIWTHYLKDISFTDWHSTTYQGPAIKMGAGVQGIDAYRAAHKRGLRVVSGECPTVGIAGGYTQGGGHSALSSRYGLGADQALEWEVIDGTGTYRRASPVENPDLYWALSGGGGGTYGVVLSLTAKAHPDGIVSSFNLTFSAEAISQDTFYDAIMSWHSALSPLVDKGIMAIWTFTNTTFAITPLTAPDLSLSELMELLQPFLRSLDSLNIRYTQYSAEFPSYLDQFTAMQAPIAVGIAQYGGRLIPRSTVVNANTNIAFTSAYRHITTHGGLFIGVALNVDQKHLNLSSSINSNAVLPAWRSTLIDTVITTPWNFTAPLTKMIANQNLMTDDFIPRLEALSPNSGAYMNEGDFRQPEWQNVFYGVNYRKLLSVKNMYDPNDVFWANRAVGSEKWEEKVDGRLCRV